QSGLLAMALRHHQPEARVALIERESVLAGNHTWSFHPGDVPESCRAWTEPLIQHRWPGYEVYIGGFHRRVQLSYASISSDHFARVVGDLFQPQRAELESLSVGRELSMLQAEGSTAGGQTASVMPGNELQCQLMTGTDVAEIEGDQVVTTCGQQVQGRLVIDCRGPAATSNRFAGCGYQKFFGFEMEFESAWPFESPVLMQSVVDQSDGFRFLYALPFGPRRVLIEDTRFSDTPDCSRDQCLDLVCDYVSRQGVGRFTVRREESGVLPMPFTSEMLPDASSPLSGGYAGGWFHAATGYSFPMAVAFADAVASGPLEQAVDRVAALSDQHRWRSKYARLLNRLLFRLVAPSERHQIFRRFYGVLNDQAIERFYSHRFTVRDARQIVVGVPPTLRGLRPLQFIQSYLNGENQ
ncbi:MAG: lycopene cyclase family protein, partial [Planctomycetota bacterium]